MSTKKPKWRLFSFLFCFKCQNSNFLLKSTPKKPQNVTFCLKMYLRKTPIFHFFQWNTKKTPNFPLLRQEKFQEDPNLDPFAPKSICKTQIPNFWPQNEQLLTFRPREPPNLPFLAPKRTQKGSFFSPEFQSFGPKRSPVLQTPKFPFFTPKRAPHRPAPPRCPKPAIFRTKTPPNMAFFAPKRFLFSSLRLGSSAGPKTGLFGPKPSAALAAMG